MTSPDMTIAHLLEANPHLVENLAALPNLGHIRNPAARKMISMMTIAQVARLVDVPVADLVGMLRAALPGRPATGDRARSGPDLKRPVGSEAERPVEARPHGLAGLTPVELDLRDEIRAGVEPFARIMTAARALGASESLVLLTPFEPIPLYEVLAKGGLAHWAERAGDGDWRVWFYRGPGSGTHQAVERETTTAEVNLDVRDLEAPLPMVRVLEGLDTLGPDQTLVVLHQRRPMFLYPQLEDRGFTHETDEPAPGLVRIHIRHRPRP